MGKGCSTQWRSYEVRPSQRSQLSSSFLDIFYYGILGGSGGRRKYADGTQKPVSNTSYPEGK